MIDSIILLGLIYCVYKKQCLFVPREYIGNIFCWPTKAGDYKGEQTPHLAVKPAKKAGFFSYFAIKEST